MTTTMRTSTGITVLRTEADLPALQEWLEQGHGPVALDTETTGLEPRDPGFLVGVVCLAAADGTGWVVDGRDRALVRAVLRLAFAAGEVWAHNADYDARALYVTTGLKLTTLACSLVAARTLWPGLGHKTGFSLKVLRPTTDAAQAALRDHWGEVRGTPVAPSEGKIWLPEAVRGLPFDDVFLTAYVAEDTVQCADLATEILAHPALEHARLDVRIDQAWRWTAHQGLRVDRTLLHELRADVEVELEAIAAIYGFKPWTNNRARYAWLTETLGVTLPRDRKNKRPTTSRKAWKRAIVPPAGAAGWAEFMRISTLGSTLGKLVELDRSSAQDSRAHPRITANVARTGRMGVSGPALQNLAGPARALFLPDVGYVLVAADLDHVEPSVLAIVSGDPVLRVAVKGDVYQEIVTLIWPEHTLRDTMTAEELAENSARRKRAKTILLALMYGMGNRSLADSLGGTHAEAVGIRQQVLQAWPEVRNWQRETDRRAASDRLVTLTGRPLPVDPQARYRAHNYSIQGSAADIFKRMTLEVKARLPRDARLWLPVHDELVVQCRPADAERCKTILAECMTLDVEGVLITAEPVGPWDRWQK